LYGGDQANLHGFPSLNAFAEKAKRNGKLKFSEFKAFHKVAIQKGKTRSTFK
jgi:hypothetical protein